MVQSGFAAEGNRRRRLRARREDHNIAALIIILNQQFVTTLLKAVLLPLCCLLPSSFRCWRDCSFPRMRAILNPVYQWNFWALARSIFLGVCANFFWLFASYLQAGLLIRAGSFRRITTHFYSVDQQGLREEWDLAAMEKELLWLLTINVAMRRLTSNRLLSGLLIRAWHGLKCSVGPRVNRYRRPFTLEPDSRSAAVIVMSRLYSNPDV